MFSNFYTNLGLGPEQTKSINAAAEKRSAMASEDIPCSACILATGHSARDVYTMLQTEGIPMEPKGESGAKRRAAKTSGNIPSKSGSSETCAETFVDIYFNTSLRSSFLAHVLTLTPQVLP